MPSQSAIYAGRAGSGTLNLRLLGSYLRSGAGLGEPVREGCILAITGECDNAFEWAAHEPEALRSGCRSRSLMRSESRAPTADVKAPFETVVELIRQGFTARSVRDNLRRCRGAAGVRLPIDLVSPAGIHASTAALLTLRSTGQPITERQ